MISPLRPPAPVFLAILAVSGLAISPVPAGTQSPQPNTPAPQARTGGAPSLDDLFATLDKDRDGRISKEEAAGLYASRFAAWDSDRDGFATRQDIHNYRLSLGIDDRGQRTAGRTSADTSATKTASVLLEPADWRLETMSVPPGFAPDVKLTGSEEIRFAPGMFDNTARDYFTCVLAITSDGAAALGAPELRDFLEKYYRGLSASRARRSGASPNLSEMQAVVNPAPVAPETGTRFDGDVVFFDSFSDGRKITLHVEAEVIPQPASRKTCLILLVSPGAKETDVWPKLREIGKKASARAREVK